MGQKWLLYKTCAGHGPAGAEATWRLVWERLHKHLQEAKRMNFRYRTRGQLGRMALQLMRLGVNINVGEMRRTAQRLARRWSWRDAPLTAKQTKTLRTIGRASGGVDYRSGDFVDPLVDEPGHLAAVPALVNAGLVMLPMPGLGTPLASQKGATPVRLTAEGLALAAAANAMEEVTRLRDIILTNIGQAWEQVDRLQKIIAADAVARATEAEMWATELLVHVARQRRDDAALADAAKAIERLQLEVERLGRVKAAAPDVLHEALRVADAERDAAVHDAERLRRIIQETLAPGGAVTRAPVDELWEEIIRREQAGAGSRAIRSGRRLLAVEPPALERRPI